MINLYCVIGRGGSGKTYIVDKMMNDPYLVDTYGPFHLIKEHTDRPRRSKTEDGYFFETKESFAAKVRSGQMAAYSVYDTKLADGTPDKWSYGIVWDEVLYYEKECDPTPVNAVVISNPDTLGRLIDDVGASTRVKLIPILVNPADEDFVYRNSVKREQAKDLERQNFPEMERRYTKDKEKFDRRTKVITNVNNDTKDVIVDSVSHFLLYDDNGTEVLGEGYVITNSEEGSEGNYACSGCLTRQLLDILRLTN